MQDTNTNDLTDKQKKFIDLYFKYNSINDICKELDISRQTYYNYLNNEIIRNEIDRIRTQYIENVTTYLQDNLMTCSIKLMEIIQDDKTTANTKINAINSVFNNCIKLTEQTEIIDKINKIKEIYERLQDATKE
jgi:predicted DNA-binding protein YlxM (UPF0122 family)